MAELWSMEKVLIPVWRLITQFIVWMPRAFNPRLECKDNFIVFLLRPAVPPCTSKALINLNLNRLKFRINYFKIRLNQDGIASSSVDETPSPVLVTSNWMTAMKLLDNLTHPLYYDRRMRPANVSQVDSPISVSVGIYVVALGSLDSIASVYYFLYLLKSLLLLLCIVKNGGGTLTIRRFHAFIVCVYSSRISGEIY